MPNYVSTLDGQQITSVMTQIDQGVPEGWAVGEKNGIPVSSSSPYYHNNAKYYAQYAQGQAERAEAAVPAGTAGAVFFDRVQTLTAGQQKQARENIGTDKPSENKTASGDIVSFTDGSATPVKSLKATLDIVQGGAGTPSPSNVRPLYPVTGVWVSRTGKNLLIETFEQGAGNNNDITTRVRSKNTIWVEKGKTYTFSASTYNGFKYVLNSGVTQAYPWTNFAYCGNPASWVQTAITFTATTDGWLGVIVAYPNDGTITPANVAGIKMQVEIGSTATAYEPYTGYDKYLVNIGINQWDEEWESGVYSITVGSPLTKSANANYIRAKNTIPVLPNTSYYCKMASTYDTIIQVDEANNVVKVNNANSSGYYLLTTESTTVGIVLYSYGTTYGNNVSINYPSRFTSYYPYTGRQVYGGELDVTSGVLTSKYLAGKPSDLSFTTITAGGVQYFYIVPTDIKSNTTDVICSSYRNYGAGVAPKDKTFTTGWAYISPSKSIVFRDDSYATLADFIAGNAGMLIAYELATPLTIQLTPTEVQTLTGTNNLWADSGAVNVSYWTEGLIEADNFNAVLDSKKVVYASPHTYSKEDALQARLNIGAESNRNLLPNPWFTINQRGATSGIGDLSYCSDRWRAYNCSWVVNSDKTISLTFTGSGAGILTIIPFEADMVGKNYTLSVMLANGEVYSGTVVAPSRGVVQTGIFNNLRMGLSVTQNGLYQISLYLRSGTATIKAMKLEKGSVSTLANDILPDYAEELVKCQRYDRQYESWTGYVYLTTALSTAANTARAVLEGNLRDATRTVSFSGVSLTDGSTSYPVTAITAISYGGGYTNISVTSSGLTTGKMYFLQLAPAGFINISADL